jgi:hypothetical protein
MWKLTLLEECHSVKTILPNLCPCTSYNIEENSSKHNIFAIIIQRRNSRFALYFTERIAEMIAIPRGRAASRRKPERNPNLSATPARRKGKENEPIPVNVIIIPTAVLE